MKAGFSKIIEAWPNSIYFKLAKWVSASHVTSLYPRSTPLRWERGDSHCSFWFCEFKLWDKSREIKALAGSEPNCRPQVFCAKSSWETALGMVAIGCHGKQRRVQPLCPNARYTEPWNRTSWELGACRESWQQTQRKWAGEIALSFPVLNHVQT